MTTAPDTLTAVKIELEKLIHGYAACIDAGDFNGVAGLFARGRISAPDGTVLAEGYDDVLAFYRATVRLHPESGTPRTQHVVSNIVLSIDMKNGVAQSRSTYTVFQQTADLPLQAIVTGTYNDRFRCVEGRWCFRERKSTPNLVGELGQHLLRFSNRMHEEH